MSNDRVCPLSAEEFRAVAGVMSKIDDADATINTLADSIPGPDFIEAIGAVVLVEIKVSLGIDLKASAFNLGEDEIGSEILAAVFMTLLERRGALVKGLNGMVQAPRIRTLQDFMQAHKVAGAVDV